MKFAKKVRGFSMPQMIASVAIASVLTAVGANYYWDIVDEASTVGMTQSIGVVRDTLALTHNDLGGMIHKIDANFAAKANSRVSGLDNTVGNIVVSVSNAAGTESSWWYVMAAQAKDGAKLKSVAAKLEAEYDAGAANGALGQVLYQNTCTAIQDPGTPVYSDCWVAVNILNSPGTALTLTAADLGTGPTNLKISFKDGDIPKLDTAQFLAAGDKSGFVLQ